MPAARPKLAYLNMSKRSALLAFVAGTVHRPCGTSAANGPMLMERRRQHHPAPQLGWRANAGEGRSFRLRLGLYLVRLAW